MRDVFYRIFFIFFIFFAGAERIRATFKNKRSVSKRNWLTTVPIMTYVLIVLTAVTEVFFSKRPISYFVVMFGLLLYFGGFFLRVSAMRLFQQRWNIHTDAENVERIVSDGPFKYMAHPYYMAVMLELTGIALVANSYLAIILVLLVQYPFLIVRCNVEERALIQKFGNEYLAYKKGKLTIFPVRGVS